MNKYRDLLTNLHRILNLNTEVYSIETYNLIKKSKTDNNLVIELTKLHNTLKPIDDELKMDTYLGSYSSYINSPVWNGKLQFDLWDNFNTESLILDWNNLRDNIKTWGIRNSLLLAPMPTASTSQILGNNECIEPFTSNIYLRRTLAGEFTVINKHLLNSLVHINIWDNELKNKIIRDDGSIQNIDEIPKIFKDIYKTVLAYELCFRFYLPK